MMKMIIIYQHNDDVHNVHDVHNIIMTYIMMMNTIKTVTPINKMLIMIKINTKMVKMMNT